MARIRSVKPEFWSSPDTASCRDPWARLLFVAMWNWADDEGRGTANPKELAGFAFPHDENIDSAAIRRMLGEVRRAFGVVFYVVRGRSYYAIPSWNNHQKIDKRSGGKFPAPEDGAPWDPEDGPGSDQGKQANSASAVEDSEEPAEEPPSPLRTHGAGTGEQGNRGTGTKTSSSSSDAHRADVEKLCSHLADWIIRNGCKPPTIGQKWRDAARLMLDTDKRELDKALALIDWCQRDSFWHKNILSMPKFREKYDQLRLAALDDWQRQSRPASRRPNADDTIRDLLNPTGSDGATVLQLEAYRD